jgi:hypothetical protein
MPAEAPSAAESRSTGRRAERGILLVECLIYMGVFFVLVGLGFVTMYRCWDNYKHLSRGAADISSAVHEGERWRADVRLAVAPIRLDEGDQGETRFFVPQSEGEVGYVLWDGTLFRKPATSNSWSPVLENVANSRMIEEPRTQVTAWRWELELKTRHKHARMHPLFTFKALPSFEYNP